MIYLPRIGLLLLSIWMSLGCGWISGQTRAGKREREIFTSPRYLKVARAVREGDTKKLDRLFRDGGFDVDFEGAESQAPWGRDTARLLTWATFWESQKGMEWLLRHGADPNKSTAQGVTPLMNAMMTKDKIPTLLLLKYKANPNVCADFWGGANSPLTIALHSGLMKTNSYFDRAQLLIDHGANLDLNLDRGKTAVINLAIHRNWGGVLWLLERGANFEARDQSGVTLMCRLRLNFIDELKEPEPSIDPGLIRVRDWLLTHGVVASRMDPVEHPSPKCDD